MIHLGRVAFADQVLSDDLPELIINEKEFFFSAPYSITDRQIDFTRSSINWFSLDQPRAESSFFSSKEFTIADFSLSADGRYLLITEIISTGDHITNNKIIIMDLKTKRQQVVDTNVGRFHWSPSGHLLCYVTAIYHEGFAGMSTTAAWIYDPSTGKKDSIAMEIAYLDLFWSYHDNNIYFTDMTKVYTHDVKKKQTSLSTRKGILFSPNGEYYARRGYESSSMVIYQAQNDLPLETVNRAMTEADESHYFLTWLANGDYLFLRGGGYNNFVLDMKTAKIARSFTAWVVGIDWKREYCLVHDLIAEGEKKGAIDRDRVRLMKILE